MDQKTQLLLQKRDLNFAKRGISRGLLAGAAWGLDGVLMGIPGNNEKPKLCYKITDYGTSRMKYIS